MLSKKNRIEILETLSEFGLASQELGCEEERHEMGLDNDAFDACKRMKELHNRLVSMIQNS